MAKFILGLDIGTNSIGWVLLKDNRIFDKGIIIFPIGTNVDKNGIESTKNMQRGTYRRTSRNHFRYKLRRKELKKFLAELRMLPTFSNTFKIKDKYQASELYRLRNDAISKQIPQEELGRIFLLINKHRGFKSNSKTLSETKDDEGVVKESIKSLSDAMKANNSRTLGEYFHKMYEKSAQKFDDGKWHNIDEPFDERAIVDEDNFSITSSRGIRREGRFIAREMYADEFDLIWDEQKKYYPQLTGSKKEYDEICKLPVEEKRAKLEIFKKTKYWEIKHKTIFFQRPLKSQKKFIGKCQFEKNKRTAPASSLLFQEFRIWKQLADIRYSDKENNIYSEPLPKEWKQKIADYLETNLSLSLRPKKLGSGITDVLELLGITNKKNFEFNYSDSNEDEKSFHGNKTLFAIHTTCGDEKYNQLKQENKLEKLWHILYMAKDDEWLKDTLTWKWGFDDDTAMKLVEMGLEEGFANYSSKVLKKILPFLIDGKDEHDSLILANYLQSSDEYKEVKELSKRIKQLANNELRNPVVEKAVGETIRLVNTVLKLHEIDQEDFTIRVESTREFKKPKKERENIRRKNLDTEKRREEYARFLNEKKEKGEVSFNRKIQKNDSIINKFELWLELGADKNDPDFKDFEKIVERKDREKHTLWLDCNRICPYTGNIIPLSKLFSPEIEIEHIIPYSWSLDNSFTNKTLTFGYINKEKANKSAYEYMKSKGPVEFKAFQSRVKVFNKEKAEERFLNAKPEQTFTNAQGRNASYIAVYVRKKLQEVCRDVQFTNGFATGELRKNDWRLGTLLDKVRYQEETGIDVDKYTREFANYRRDFEYYKKRKANSTDVKRTDWKNLTPEVTAEYEAETKNPIYEWWQELQKFDEFRGAKGKKDRSDHRHHLLDAVVIAMCSPSIIQKLSTLNQQREKQGATLYDEKGELTRDRIDLPISYSEIKETLESVLVYHKAEQRLITAKQNRIHKKKKGEDDTSVIKQRTLAPRGSLVGDNFYGKLKKPQNQGFAKDAVFVKRVEVNGDNFKDKKALDKVVDKNLRKILELRLDKYDDKGDKAFSKEALLTDPLFIYSTTKYPNGLPNTPESKKGNPLPVIKKIRVANKNSRNLIQLTAKDEDGNIVNANRYSEADGNYVMALYESKEIDKKGKVKIKRDFEIVSFFKAVERRRKGEKLYPDEKEQKDGSFLPLMRACPYLKAGDFVVMYEEKKSEIDWDIKEDLMKRLYTVTQLASSIKNVSNKDYLFGSINFAKHNHTKAGASYKGSDFKNNLLIPFITNYHTQLKVIKVQVDRLGNIKPIL